MQFLPRYCHFFLHFWTLSAPCRSHTTSVYCLPNMKDQISHPHKTTDTWNRLRHPGDRLSRFGVLQQNTNFPENRSRGSEYKKGMQSGPQTPTATGRWSYMALSLLRKGSGKNANLSQRLINPLKTKRRLLYLKAQFVPRCKHFSTRL
jgi:hypothetical protein